MDTSEQIRLMHAVLDGEATPDEVTAVEALVASDPAARVRYEELRRVFETLEGMPRLSPPA